MLTPQQDGSARPIQRQPDMLAGVVNHQVQYDLDAMLSSVGAKAEGSIPITRHSIQRKLRIGAVGDQYEQEADRVAAQVVRQMNMSPAQPDTAQRNEKSYAEDTLQMKPKVQRSVDEGGEVSAELESAIDRARGSGQSLDSRLQAKMGQAMGADFSGVQVHTDALSDQLNQALQAKAFTLGQDVFFRQGAYEPESWGGQELIAHELTHVVQQNGNRIRRSSLHKNNSHSYGCKCPSCAALATQPAIQRKHNSQIEAVAPIKRPNNILNNSSLFAKHRQVKVAPNGEALGLNVGQNGLYGFTWPQAIRLEIGAKKSGDKWKPVLKNIIGEYSVQADVLNGQTDIPNANAATQLNYQEMLDSLDNLGNGNYNYYSKAAVVAHESKHASRCLQALEETEQWVVEELDNLGIPLNTAGDENAAVLGIQALAPYTNVVIDDGYDKWLNKVVALVQNDHNGDGPCENAEKGVTRPLAAAIRERALQQGWVGSPPPKTLADLP